MSDETNLYFNLDDEDNEKRVVVRVSELVRCLKHFRESLLCNGGDYEHDMREIGGHLKAATLGGSTLTAEHVREVLLIHLPHREYYSIAQTDAWQAIADELNELGSEINGNTSRYAKLFGTPEKAARTLANNCHRDGCIACAAMGFDCGGGDYDTLLEWLKGGSE